MLFSWNDWKFLIVKVAEFSNLSTKNIDRQRYFIMCFKVFQVKWDIPVVEFFQKNVPKFVCSMVKFSMPAIFRWDFASRKLNYVF